MKGVYGTMEPSFIFLKILLFP